MAESTTKLTPQQKVEKVRKAIEDENRGYINPENFTPEAVLHSAFLGEVRGRDAIVAALKKLRDQYDEFHEDPHSILADDDHLVALVNITARSKGQEAKIQLILVGHTNAQGQISEWWSMVDADTIKRLSSR